MRLKAAIPHSEKKKKMVLAGGDILLVVIYGESKDDAGLTKC